MMVSPHFSLRELTRTEIRSHQAEQANPPPEIRSNLAHLAYNYLEPARLIVGPLRVNSAYRTRSVNLLICGSPRSLHLDALAADVEPLQMGMVEAYGMLAQSSIPFDQLILELPPDGWIHIGAPRRRSEPRLQRLVMWQPGRYETWRPDDPRLMALA